MGASRFKFQWEQKTNVDIYNYQNQKESNFKDGNKITMYKNFLEEIERSE